MLDAAKDLSAFLDLLEEGVPPHRVREVSLWGSEEPNC
jgi:hypothetical protein